MYRRTLPILLALLLAACPLTCRVIALATCGESVESAECTDCCHCNEGEGERQSDGDRTPSPLPACPCQDECSDCICAGALDDGADIFDPSLLPSLDWLATLSNPLPAAIRACHETSGREGHLLAIDGRGVRTRISSFLC